MVRKLGTINNNLHISCNNNLVLLRIYFVKTGSNITLLSILPGSILLTIYVNNNNVLCIYCILCYYVFN